MTRYAKWHDSSDHWVLWNDTGDAEIQYLKPKDYQLRYGVSAEEEYFNRFGSRADIPGWTRADLDHDPRTNPALYWWGESNDEANGRLYSRPLPSGSAPYVSPA